MNKINHKNLLLLGITLFSMFFGAGNLIFPPFLGFVARDRGLPDALLIVLAACLCLAAGSVFFRGGKKR